jgi:alpha-tubulin suppressor-like RCC1 family protein
VNWGEIAIELVFYHRQMERHVGIMKAWRISRARGCDNNFWPWSVAIALLALPLGCGGSDGDSTRIATLKDVVSLASGDEHTCALRSDGTVACWGSNQYGQIAVENKKDLFETLDPIGLTTVTSVYYHGTAEPVEGLTGVKQIAAGMHHTCALLKNGSVYCWGDSALGQLGGGDFSLNNCSGRPCSRRPVQVKGIKDATAIAAGGESSCAIHRGGTLSCWGGTALGVDAEKLKSCDRRPCATQPVVVEKEPKVKAVAMGAAHGCLLREDGKVACWGSNIYGQVGIVSPSDITAETPPVLGNVERPTDVALPPSNKAIALIIPWYAETSCVILEDNALYCWGRNDLGQLGIGDYEQTCATNASSYVRCATTPHQTTPSIKVEFSRFAIELRHSCALSADVLYCWGWGQFGQLGIAWDELDTCDELNRCARTPRRTLFADESDSEMTDSVTDVAVGDNFTCAVISNRQLRCAGWTIHSESDVDGSVQGINCASWCPVNLGSKSSIDRIMKIHLDRLCVLTNQGEIQCLRAYNPETSSMEVEPILVKR